VLGRLLQIRFVTDTKKFGLYLSGTKAEMKVIGSSATDQYSTSSRANACLELIDYYSPAEQDSFTKLEQQLREEYKPIA
jgi:hypothetical protein